MKKLLGIIIGISLFSVSSIAYATGTSTIPWFTTNNASTTPYFINGIAPTLNILSTATSTFSGGIQVTGGCVKVGNSCLGTGGNAGTVTSIGTNNGLTGGTITTTGTIGLSVGQLSTNAPVTWTGSVLSATGTPSFTSGYFNATSTSATSTFSNGISFTGGCVLVNNNCLTSNNLTIGGASSTIQYNQNGVLGGNTGLIYDGTNVGIGTTAPIKSLDVAGDAIVSGNLYLYPLLGNAPNNHQSISGDQFSNFNFTSASGSFIIAPPNIRFTSGGAGFYGAANGQVMGFNDSGGTGDYISISNTNAGGYATLSTAGGSTNINLDISPKGSGKTGIATTTPWSTFSVTGSSDLGNSALAGYFTGTTTATSTLAGGLQTLALNVTSTTATSTFANGINIATGCYSIAGSCISSGSSSFGENIEVLTSIGTSTFPIQAGTTTIEVTVIGAGANGNSTTCTVGNSSGGTGGRSGGMATGIFNVSGTSTIQFHIGAGNAAQFLGTSFGTNGFYEYGGDGGGGNAVGSGGALNLNGQIGATGDGATGFSSFGQGGLGASTQYGQGGPGGVNAGGNAAVGYGAGGGGTGCGNGSGSGASGGNGTQGAIIIKW